MKELELMNIMKQNDFALGSKVYIMRNVLEVLRERQEPEAESLLRKDFLLLEKHYNSIDYSIQTSETGKDILIEAKEKVDGLSNLLKNFLEGGALNLDETQYSQAFSLMSDIGICSKDYVCLPAYQKYREFNKIPKGMSRTKWLESGKPAS